MDDYQLNRLQDNKKGENCNASTDPKQYGSTIYVTRYAATVKFNDKGKITFGKRKNGWCMTKLLLQAFYSF